MRCRASPRLFLSLVVALALAPSVARADDACAAFTWDVAHERALFAEEPQPTSAARSPTAAPPLAPERLYQLQLSEQSQVTFAAPPGAKPRGESTYAGLARLTVDASGVYRIALSDAVWVDAVVNGAALGARDFQGRPGCNAPHKVLEFELPGKTPVTLQFSASRLAAVEVTVTRVPAGTR